MPPKPMFTREEIVQAALDIVSERGIEALTARELGVKLGSSARPLFTVFKNMEELHEAVRAAAMARFEACAPDGMENAPIFTRLCWKTNPTPLATNASTSGTITDADTNVSVICDLSSADTQ